MPLAGITLYIECLYWIEWWIEKLPDVVYVATVFGYQNQPDVHHLADPVESSSFDPPYVPMCKVSVNTIVSMCASVQPLHLLWLVFDMVNCAICICGGLFLSFFAVVWNMCVSPFVVPGINRKQRLYFSFVFLSYFSLFLQKKILIAVCVLITIIILVVFLAIYLT